MKAGRGFSTGYETSITPGSEGWRPASSRLPFGISTRAHRSCRSTWTLALSLG